MSAYLFFVAFVLLVALGGFVWAGFDLLVGWIADGRDAIDQGVGRR